jgi:hypothetical protein
MWHAWLEAGVTFKCELCGNDHWSLVRDSANDGLAIHLRAGTNGQNIFAPTYLIYAVSCSKCGNLRQFEKDTIERLASEYREKEAQRNLRVALGASSGS